MLRYYGNSLKQQCSHSLFIQERSRKHFEKSSTETPFRTSRNNNTDNINNVNIILMNKFFVTWVYVKLYVQSLEKVIVGGRRESLSNLY